MRTRCGPAGGALGVSMALALLACSNDPGELVAQSDGRALEEGAATITPADLRARVGVLAHDSMRGRDTPSPELEKTARYVADAFREFGLRPAVGDGYIQRYPLTIIRPGSASAQRLALRGPVGERAYAASDFISIPVGEGLEGAGPIVLLPSMDAEADLGGKIALVRVGERDLQRALAQFRDLLDRGANGVILAVEGGPSYFAGLRRFFERERLLPGEPQALGAPALLVPLDRLPEPLGRALSGADPTPTGWSASVRSDAVVRRAEGLNTVGWLEGSDPELRGEYVVFTAHMDHVGVGRPVAGDSIYNGADDDASGTATVIELAQAFASMTPRPRRSLVFLTVSGEEKGLWGSDWYARHPSFPLEATVANLNIDMIGRNWRDTVVAIGKEESTLGPTLERIAAEHPELDLEVIDDPWPEERFYFRSDHYNFARRGVPILFFFTGTHADYHRPSDEPDRILYEKTARIARLIFYLGAEVADAPEPPRWDPAAYRRVVETEGGR